MNISSPWQYVKCTGLYNSVRKSVNKFFFSLKLPAFLRHYYPTLIILAWVNQLFFFNPKLNATMSLLYYKCINIFVNQFRTKIFLHIARRSLIFHKFGPNCLDSSKSTLLYSTIFVFRKLTCKNQYFFL